LREDDEAFTGALLWAEHFDHLRALRLMVEALGKGGKSHRRR